jgi:hypothetical protein
VTTGLAAQGSIETAKIFLHFNWLRFVTIRNAGALSAFLGVGRITGELV